MRRMYSCAPYGHPRPINSTATVRKQDWQSSFPPVQKILNLELKCNVDAQAQDSLTRGQLTQIPYAYIAM